MFLSFNADREREEKKKKVVGGVKERKQVALGDHSAVASALKARLSPH